MCFLGVNVGKLSNKRLSTLFFEQEGGEKIERKTVALALMLAVVSTVIIAGLAASAYAQTSTTSPATSATTATSPVSIAATENASFPSWDSMIMGDQGFGVGPGRMTGPGGRSDMFGGPMGNIEVSSAYNQTVSNILDNDTDVKNLVSQGYNVTSINPILISTIGADGTLTTKASTAIVTMQNGTFGFATVSVDITNAKVTQIIIITRTVIDKSTTSTTTS